ncbi:MAG: GntR family transcriptional regulator [Planctomycetota bacterium]|nr:GntR family transcriptional regulator [Planctomycetota bacterium]
MNRNARKARKTPAAAPGWTGAVKLHRGADRDPLFVQLREGIRQSILDGRLRPGDALLPQRQLCRTFKINQVTATQAVSDLLREGLLRSEHGRGIFVNDVRPPLVAVVYPKSEKKMREGGLYQNMLAAAVERLTRENLRVAYCTREQESRAFRFGPPLEEVLAMDAALYLTVGIQNEEYLGALAATGRPVVALDAAPTSVSFDGVVFDTFRDGYLCTRRLLEAGHRRIACIGHDRGAHPVDASGRTRIPEPDAFKRQSGYLYAMAQAGLGFDARELCAILPAGERPAAWLRARMGEGVTAAVATEHTAEWLAGQAEVPKALSLAVMGLERPGTRWSGTYMNLAAAGQAAGAQALRRLRRSAGGQPLGQGALVVCPPEPVEGDSIAVVGPPPESYAFFSRQAASAREARP